MTFALITEGVSEYRVIKHIIAKFFKEQEPFINQISPKIVNEKQETPGGWNEVLKYCERPELEDILKENDYLIIQIDSDQSQTLPFDISHIGVDGQMKSAEILYQDIKQKLTALIHSHIFEKYKNKIFFAISIHTIECWLLPLFYNTSHKTQINNCLSTLNSALAKKNIQTIPAKSKNSSNAIKAYNQILLNIKRKSDVENICIHNVGFKNLIDTLKENINRG